MYEEGGGCEGYWVGRGGELETIVESSAEAVGVTPESSARGEGSQARAGVSSIKSMRPRSTNGAPRLGRRPSHGSLGSFPDRRAFLAEMEAQAAENHSKSSSARAIDAALQASQSAAVSAATGPRAAHWPVIDETHKYAVARKNNWSQTDEDKDLTTLRGIHSTIDFITRGLNSFDAGLERVKTEIRTGKRDSLEAELRSAHEKYRKQAQWEIDKLAAQLDAQRKAQNSMIASAVVSARMKLQRSWDAKLAEMEAPLRARIEELEGEVRQRSHRLVESENEADMLRQDKLHLEQKLANMVTEMESGTYSPMVKQLMEEVNEEQDRNESLRRMRDELELDLKELRAAARKEAEELAATRQRLTLAHAENSNLRRKAAEKVHAAEEAAKAEVRAIQEVAGGLREELHAARGDFHRQVQIQDVMNAKYTEQAEALRAKIRQLEEMAENERRRVTSFLQTSSVPMVMRELSRAVNSKRLADRNGVSELKKQVVTLVNQLNQVIAGLPEAIRMMEGARIPSSLPPASFFIDEGMIYNAPYPTPRPPPVSAAIGGGPHQYFPFRGEAGSSLCCGCRRGHFTVRGDGAAHRSTAPPTAFGADHNPATTSTSNQRVDLGITHRPQPSTPPPSQPNTSNNTASISARDVAASFPMGIAPVSDESEEISAELSFSPRARNNDDDREDEAAVENDVVSTTSRFPALVAGSPRERLSTHYERSHQTHEPPPPLVPHSRPMMGGGGGFVAAQYWGKVEDGDDDPPPESVVAQLREMGHVKDFIKSYQDDLRATLAEDDGVSHARHQPPTRNRTDASASPRARVPKLVLPNPSPRQSRAADYHIHSATSARDGNQAPDEEEAVDMFSSE